MSGPEFCVRCDRPILGEGVQVDGGEDSPSGARPPSYVHPECTWRSPQGIQR
ncbi:hypothetical protein ACWF94_06110 [Streptomyces sp. NPDC055078]